MRSLRRFFMWSVTVLVVGCNALLDNAEHNVADVDGGNSGSAGERDANGPVLDATATPLDVGAAASDRTLGVETGEQGTMADVAHEPWQDAPPLDSGSADAASDRPRDGGGEDADTACAGPCTTTVAGATSSCQGGICSDVCTNPTESVCLSACVPLGSDLANCGICGNICPTGATCIRGACACPSGSTTTCSGQCVDTRTDPKNCGACGHPCPGACMSGLCQCVTENTHNLVANGGFDANVSRWRSSDINFLLQWSSLDAASCQTSGSILVTDQTAVGATADIAQCVPALPGTAYNFGGWVRRPSGGGAGYTGLSVDWRRGADCSMPTGQGPFIPAKGTLDAWELLSQDGIVSPPGIAAALIVGQASRTQGTSVPYQTYFDAIYLTPAPGHF